jgi:hypothetical protein
MRFKLQKRRARQQRMLPSQSAWERYSRSWTATLFHTCQTTALRARITPTLPQKLCATQCCLSAQDRHVFFAAEPLDAESALLFEDCSLSKLGERGHQLGIGSQQAGLVSPNRIRVAGKTAVDPARFYFDFFADFLRDPSGRRRTFPLVVAIPPPLFGTSSHEEFVSSKFGTRWYANAAAAPLLQQFENYYGASH